MMLHPTQELEPPAHPERFTLNRKNALFAGHDEGGNAWGRIASLIETCKINGIEPFAYLKATLTAIANGHPQSDIDDLLPWNFKPSS
jgi:transposase